MRSHLLAMGLLLVGCAATSPAMISCPPEGCGALTDPPISDGEPLEHAWAELSLSMEGPEVSDRKREVCRQEARAAGVRLVPGAKLAATIHLGDDGNRVQLEGRPARKLGQGGTEGICRTAIAAALHADTRVVTFEAGTLPEGCALVGAVTSQDQGPQLDKHRPPGSFDTALLYLKLQALQQGGNVVHVDAMRQIGFTLYLDGRIFRCAAPPPAVQAPATVTL